MIQGAVMSLVFLMTFVSSVQAREIHKPGYLKLDIAEQSKQQLFEALNALFLQIDRGELDRKHISPDNADLTISVLQSLKLSGSESQLINCYPISGQRYLLSLAFFEGSEPSSPQIRMIVNLIADETDRGVTFSVPLAHLTRHWHSQTVGRMTYRYRASLNHQRAEVFDAKNTAIAGKLGLEPEAFDFYMCENYQEVLELLGIEYDAESNGKTRDGYGVDAGTIFSIANNEDFSHDAFHYYSGKINKREDRNWIAEEGVAYSWGNAYYTDGHGAMIEQVQLVAALAQHLEQHPSVSLLELFENNTKIFNHLAPEVSVCSTISSLICDEVEREKGMGGLQQLINCGSQDRMESYLKAIDALLGIRRENFNERVKALIDVMQGKAIDRRSFSPAMPHPPHHGANSR